MLESIGALKNNRPAHWRKTNTKLYPSKETPIGWGMHLFSSTKEMLRLVKFTCMFYVMMPIFAQNNDNGPLLENSILRTRQPLPTTTKKAALRTRRPYIQCNFDTDFCSFENERDLEWKRWTMAGPPKTGPEKDHTSGTGYYALFDVKQNKEGSEAVLNSPELFSPSQCTTVSFWYYAYGSQLGIFRVKTVSGLDSPDEVSDTIFEINDPEIMPSKRWELFEDTYWLHSDRYLISFEAVAGEGPEGDFAIDDVNIRATACPEGIIRKSLLNNTTPQTAVNVTTTLKLNEEEDEKQVQLPGNAIAAIVIIVVIFTVAAIPGFFILWRKYKARKGLPPLADGP